MLKPKLQSHVADQVLSIMPPALLQHQLDLYVGNTRSGDIASLATSQELIPVTNALKPSPSHVQSTLNDTVVESITIVSKILIPKFTVTKIFTFLPPTEVPDKLYLCTLKPQCCRKPQLPINEKVNVCEHIQYELTML